MSARPQLPTVEQCVEFLEAVNARRVKGGLEPLNVIDFDGADPNNGHNCLSARNLYRPLFETIDAHWYVGTRNASAGGNVEDIPERILAVTDYFDGCDPREHGWPLDDLRARMVEAGVAAP